MKSFMTKLADWVLSPLTRRVRREVQEAIREELKARDRIYSAPLF